MMVRAHRSLSLDRTVALTFVVGAHAALIYLIAVNGLFRPVAADPQERVMDATFLPDDRPRIEPLEKLAQAPLQDQFAEPIVPDVIVDFPPQDSDPIADRLPVPRTGPAGDEVFVAPRFVASTPLTYTAQLGTRDFYPAASLRLGEEGATMLRVCVSARGQLQQAAVTGSSGHARLDAAAQKWAREALVFRPATEGGAAVASCKAFRVIFTLTP